MALIGKIRNNSWLLIVLIGLGLGGFILMDMVSGQQSVFGQSQNVIGSIEGNKVDANEFYRAEEALYAGSSGDVFGRRSALWDYFVEDAIIKEEAEDLGLNVSKAELMDLQFGNNLSPVINARFINPTTRQVDRNQLTQIKTAIETNQLNPQYRAFWAHQEKEIVKERLQAKLNALVSKALYTPTWMAEKYHQDQSQYIDFTYVQIPFAEVADSEIELSDADFKAYLKENKSQYVQDKETRTLDYVVFEVTPTAKDSADIRNQLIALQSDFASTDDDSLFITANDGIYDPAFLKKERLSEKIADEAFSVETGTVIGPYQEGGLYQLAKVIDRMVIPDSVDSRHILRTASSQEEFANAVSTIDSLKKEIEAGNTTFEDAAQGFSQDPSNASKGGALGNSFNGKMVKEFNDVIFYTGEIGKLYTVFTQFGVHLVEVLDRTYLTNEEGVKMAYISQPIIPSVETQKERYQVALEFVGQNRTLEAMTKAATEKGLEIVTAPPVKSNDFTVGTLGAGQSSRDMIKWAFTADAGQASPAVYVYQDQTYFSDDKYVAAGLRSVQPAGDVNLASVRSEIEPLVKNRKKAEVIKSKITTGQSLPAIAGTFNAEIDTLTNVNFNTALQPGLGNEPKVIAAAFSTEVNQVSAPVVGENGVYVVQVIRKPDAGTPNNIADLRQQAARAYRGQVTSQLMQGMKKTASIKDYRSNFY